jgi:nucleotide-binding universal stress UspA family protein
MGNSILVPYDLTETTKTAVLFAAKLAQKSGSGVKILHVENSASGDDVASQLETLAGRLKAEFGVYTEFLLRKGNLIKEISDEANSRKYSMAVIGSHGMKGMKDSLLGMDVLKLVKAIAVPVITLQQGFSAHPDGINEIVLPASSHQAFEKKVNAVVTLAKLFGSTVHVYTIEKPGFEWSDNLKRNVELAISKLESGNVNFKRVNEQQTTYSPGYAKQILQYAHQSGAGLIAVVSTASDEYYYIADSDKERLLTNDHNIPVLCVSEKALV